MRSDPHEQPRQGVGEGVERNMQSREERLKCRVERRRQVAAGRLISACFQSLGEARELVEADPDCIRYQSTLGETAFHYVIVENRLDLAEFLLAAGSEINKADHYGATPLMHAVMLDHRDLIKWLIERGAAIEPKNCNGETVLCWATRNDRAWAFKFLIDLPRKHPINFYYDDLSAQDVWDDEELVMRAHLIELGLARRYEY